MMTKRTNLFVSLAMASMFVALGGCDNTASDSVKKAVDTAEKAAGDAAE